MFEALADLCVVQGERGRIPEPLRDLELRLAEGNSVAFAVDVQRPLQLATRDQRDADQGLGLEWGSSDGAYARVQMRLVREHRLAVSGRPASDALGEADRRTHDLVGVLVAGEHRLQHVLRLVCLIDRQRVERDQVGDGVGDADKKRVEALLGEDLVEDVSEAPVRLDEGRIAGWAVLEQPKMVRPDYHRSPTRLRFK